MKAEKKPVSEALEARSMTCDGVCRGIGGTGKAGMLLGVKGGINEFVKRLSHIRIICFT